MISHKMTVKTVVVEYHAPKKLRPRADSPLLARAILRAEFAKLDSDVESFVLAVQNSRHDIIGFKRLHTGTGNACGVDAAKIFRAVLVMGGRGFIVAHNHPSNDATPSDDDIQITKRLAAGAKLLGLILNDHILVTADKTVSLRADYQHAFITN